MPLVTYIDKKRHTGRNLLAGLLGIGVEAAMVVQAGIVTAVVVTGITAFIGAAIVLGTQK